MHNAFRAPVRHIGEFTYKPGLMYKESLFLTHEFLEDDQAVEENRCKFSFDQDLKSGKLALIGYNGRYVKFKNRTWTNFPDNQNVKENLYDFRSKSNSELTVPEVTAFFTVFLENSELDFISMGVYSLGSQWPNGMDF